MKNEDIPLPGYLRFEAFRAGFSSLKDRFGWAAFSSADLAPGLKTAGVVVFLDRGKMLQLSEGERCGSVFDSQRKTHTLFSSGDVVVDVDLGAQVWPR